MEYCPELNSEALKEELETLSNQRNQISRMIECKKMILASQQVMEGFYESIDAITQDHRYYL